MHTRRSPGMGCDNTGLRPMVAVHIRAGKT